MSRRTEMLGSTIQRELAEMIMRDLNDPRLPTVVSITRVKVTHDLEYADVFLSVMGTPGQQHAALNALKHSAGMMRTKLTKSLSIRQSPFLRFQLDEQLKKEIEILELLDFVRVEREQNEAAKQRAAEAEGKGGATEAEGTEAGDAPAEDGPAEAVAPAASPDDAPGHAEPTRPT